MGKEIKLPLVGKQDIKIVEIVAGIILLLGVSQLGGIGCAPCADWNLVNPLCWMQYMICLLGHATIMFAAFVLGLWLLVDGIHDKFIKN